MPGSERTVAPDGWRGEVSDLVRGAAGGFLFGVPLLYTMEVWWYGSWVDPRWMLGALGLSLVVVTVLTRTSGFRDARETNWRDAAVDGVEVVAVGLACALAVLVCLREITLDTSLAESVGKVVFEAIPFAIGAGLARQFLARQERGDDDEAPRRADGGRRPGHRPHARGRRAPPPPGPWCSPSASRPPTRSRSSPAP